MQDRVHSGPEGASIPVVAEGESACQMDAGLSVNGICLSGDRASFNAASRWYQEACQIETYWRPEVVRLAASIKNANANHEKFERLWYLAKDDVDRLKLAICGGEDVPGAIELVSVEDCERFIADERSRHIDIEARLERVRASGEGAAWRSHTLYMALSEVREQVETYPLDDTTTCMCGSPVEGHNIGSGHAPVSQADHALGLIVEGIDKTFSILAKGAVEQGRHDDYEGPDVGMHDTEIDDCDDTEPKEGAWLLSAFIELRDASAALADGPPIVGPITQRVRDAVEAANVILNATGGVATSTCGTQRSEVNQKAQPHDQ